MEKKEKRRENPPTEKKSRVNTSAQVTRARLLTAALDLFFRQGYRGTTTTQVAERAGLSVSSFFRCFPDKESLLRSITEYIFAAKDQLIQQKKYQQEEAFFVLTLDIVLQFEVTAISSSLLEMYRAAYSDPILMETMARRLVKQVRGQDGGRLDALEDKDIYEIGIGGVGLIYGYMSRPADFYFTVACKQKHAVYGVLRLLGLTTEEIDPLYARVKEMPLPQIARQLTEDALQLAQGNVRKLD